MDGGGCLNQDTTNAYVINCPMIELSAPKEKKSTIQNVDYFEIMMGRSGFSGFSQIQMS